MSRRERCRAVRMLIAVHEAGHATWYAARGLPLAHVELRPRRWRWLPPGRAVLGRCVVDGWVDDELDAAAGALAGPEAEARHLHTAVGVEWPAALAVAYADAVDDRRDARGYLHHGCDWARAQHAAREHVADHWPAIEAVAATLLTSTRLDGDQVRRLVATRATGTRHDTGPARREPIVSRSQ